MEERIIKVLYKDKIFNIKSDTPDFNEIIDFIKLESDLDLTLLEVNCDDPYFDIETFKEAIVESISDLISKIKINKELFDKSFKTLKSNSN